MELMAYLLRKAERCRRLAEEFPNQNDQVVRNLLALADDYEARAQTHRIRKALSRRLLANNRWDRTMTVLDVALIAVGVWLILIIVTGVVNEARRGIEDQRRFGSSNWERR